MTLGGAPWSVLGPALGVGAVALVSLYLLKLRRRRVEVPFVGLWQKVLASAESSALWRKLKRLFSLLVQLAVLALLLFAVGDPRLGASGRGRTIAILVDLSASMQATDGRGGGTRLDEAKRAVRGLVRGLGAEDEAMIVALDARPAPRTSLTSDERELLAATEELEPTDAAADLERGLRLAADALRSRTRPTLVLVGDGAWDDAVLARVRLRDSDDPHAITLPGVTVEYQPVGGARPADNAAVTAFAVRRYRANQTSYEVLVELTSFAARPLTGRLEILSDGEVIEEERVTLPAGERLSRIYPNLAGEGSRLEAHFAVAEPGGDLLAVDDRAYALLQPRKKLKILLVSPGNLFVEGALLLDDNLQVEKVAPAAWNAEAASKYDAVVLDGFVPPTPPAAHALYLDPQGPASPFVVAREVRAPFVTELAKDHPLTRWLALKDLNISRASVFTLERGDVAVASSFKQPLIVARDRGAHKLVALGFDVRKSDLPLRVAFPVLLVNVLEWFAGTDVGLLGSYPTGRPWHVPAPAGARELVLKDPRGRTTRAPVALEDGGRATATGDRVGFWEVGATDARGATHPAGLLAARIGAVAESRLAPRATLDLDGQRLAAPTAGRAGLKRRLWPLLALLALLLLSIEWWTYNRRVTV